MVEIVGSNFSSVAKNLYLSVKTGYPVVFIKLEEPYRGPTVLVDRAVYFTGNVTKCILVRFSSSETQKRQLLSNDDSPVRFREEEEICRNSTASETGSD
ncbi:hypothetical protein D918_01198 [Trichuris suis]|nr:hypothetical protein D918_01198 [Trichuris suis]